jgi:hypothetical protein
MGKQAKNKVKTLSVRFPQSVAVALQKRAKAQNRSLNGQIVAEIEYHGLPKISESVAGTTQNSFVTPLSLGPVNN